MIDVLDENFKKLDMVRKYTFYQYSDKCRDIGAFELRVPVVKETKWLVDRQKTRYVLFDNRVLGKIQKIAYSSDTENEREIILSGNLALYILKKRVIRGTVTFKGQSYKYIETLITSFVGNPDYPGMINVSVQFDDEERLKKVCSVVDRQATGGYVWDEISEVCEIDKLSVELIPTVVPEQSIDGVRTNISGWTFVISAGVERTRKNEDGNIPVVFSQKMSNISGVDYNRDNRDFTGLAILAGEGEGEQRKWFSVSREGLENKTGWDVEELWIDARDLQSEVAGEDALTEEEYEELIKARAKEKLAENDVKESYASTLVTALSKQYTFGKDYKKADFVTVDDEELGLSVDAQITTVTVSEQNGRKIIDPEFTYGNIVRDPMEGLKENVTLSKQNVANIKYIENKMAKFESEIKRTRAIVLRLNKDVDAIGEQYITLDKKYMDNTDGMLKHDGRCVVIGKGVKRVAVSFSKLSLISESASYGWNRTELWRGGKKYEEIGTSICSPGGGAYTSVVCSPVVVNVRENDQIWLYKINASQETIRSGSSTFMMVEVIETE